MKEELELHTIIFMDSEEKMAKMAKFWEAILGCEFVYKDSIIKGYVPNNEAYPRIIICLSDKNTTNVHFVLYLDQQKIQNINAQLEKLIGNKIKQNAQFITYEGVSIHLIARQGAQPTY